MNPIQGWLADARQNPDTRHVDTCDGVRALAILTISDHLLTHEALPALDRERSFGDMVEMALAAAFA